MHRRQTKRVKHTWGVQRIVLQPSTQLSIFAPCQQGPAALARSPLSYPSEPSSAQVSAVFPQRYIGLADQVCVDRWPDGERATGPGEQCSSLSDHPVHRAIEADNRERGDWGSNGDQRRYWTCRRYLARFQQMTRSRMMAHRPRPSGREMVCRRRLFGKAQERLMSKQPANQAESSQQGDLGESVENDRSSSYVVCFPT